MTTVARTNTTVYLNVVEANTGTRKPLAEYDTVSQGMSTSMATIPSARIGFGRERFCSSYFNCNQRRTGRASQRVKNPESSHGNTRVDAE